MLRSTAADVSAKEIFRSHKRESAYPSLCIYALKPPYLRITPIYKAQRKEKECTSDFWRERVKSDCLMRMRSLRAEDMILIFENL